MARGNWGVSQFGNSKSTKGDNEETKCWVKFT